MTPWDHMRLLKDACSVQTRKSIQNVLMAIGTNRRDAETLPLRGRMCRNACDLSADGNMDGAIVHPR